MSQPKDPSQLVSHLQLVSAVVTCQTYAIFRQYLPLLFHESPAFVLAVSNSLA